MISLISPLILRYLPFHHALITFFYINILTQVHAIDEVTVTENIEAQSDVVKSAKALSQGGVIFVSNIYFY